VTNHAPTFTSSNATASFSENSNTTGSSAAHTASGTMNFTDSDHSDTHTTSVTLKTVSWPGGTIPTASRNDLNAAMTSSILADNNGSGSIKWNFSAADKDFDFLAKNETLVLTYEVKVSDNHGGSTTHTVTLTVTGTDDKPVITMGASAVLTEQTNHTLSLSPDTAHIALNFTDQDLDNTGHTASVTGVSASGNTSGILPGSLGTAELMVFFNVDNVVKNSGSSSGTINTTFSAPDLAFDYLAAGESVTITYAVQLDDHAGGVSTQNVTVTVIGTNDKPEFICGPESAHLVEGQNLTAGNLTAHGDLLFGDIDLSDTHTVSVTASATKSGGGAVPLTNAQVLAAFHTTLDDSDGTLLGDVAWNFALADSSVTFLQAGETLTLTYNVTVKDPSNATDTETVTITILGTNHPVVITSGPEAASLSETADTTGSAAIDQTSPVPTGTLTFTDQDLSNTHTVQVTVASATWSGGSGIPAATSAALPAALATTLHDSTGSGTGGVDWTFGIADNTLDFLADGETLTVTYNVKVSDASTSSTQTVTVTVTGANDAPVITSGPESSSVAEQAGMIGSSTLDSTSPVPTGTLAFSDVDLSDVHSVNVSLDSAVWSANPDGGVPFQTFIDLQTALATSLHDSTGSGSGGVDWSFSIADKDLDFLSAGETMTATYIVTVSDGFTSSSQTVTITATGSHDDLVVSPVVATLADTPFPDTGFTGAFGNLIAEGTSGGDASNAVTVTEINGDNANLGVPIAGAHGTLFVSSDGTYSYIANSTVDPLQDGDTATDHFTFTVMDSFGATTTASFDIHVVGADDNPLITGGALFGTLTEDAGPSATVNGGFETGDLTGWFATSGVSAEFVSLGGAFGNYDANLGGGSGALEQDVTTTAGQHYQLSFYVGGDADASSSSFTAFWDGAPILTLTNVPLGFTHYTFDVVGDALDPTTQFFVDYSTDGSGLHFDELSVNPTPGPATEATSGNVTFSDVETADTHTASFAADGSGYVGTFSLDPLTESGGAGSVGWHFSVNNADIQFLAQGQTLSQTYSVFVTDDHGGSTSQEVTVTMNGANDAPTAVDDTVISDVGPGGAVTIPGWALALNDTDPDTIDKLSVDSVTSSSGGTAFGSSVVFFVEDGTLGGSFDYTVTDGHATSANAATATIMNNPTSTTTLNGGGGGEILVGNNGGGEVLNGGGGNDALIGWGGGYVMTGGSGDDIFGFQSSSDAANTVTDFNNTSASDKIAISASGYGLTPGQDPSSVFESTGDDQFVFANFHYDVSNQTLYYSPDGTNASAHVVATFQPGVFLHANDLLIV
jgi:VCBS repeat-containing protein